MKQLTFGEFTLDPSMRQLRRGEQVLSLPGKAVDLLIYMAHNPNRLLPKDELLAAVWPDSFVEEANLSQNVFLLRKAFGAEGSTLIQTLAGRGYQFTARVMEQTQPVAGMVEPLHALPAVMQRVEATQTRVVYQEESEEHVSFWRSPLTLSITCVAALLLAATGWLGWQRYEDRVGGPPVQVVLADFEGGTGDVVLDRTLKDVLRIELAQSPFVTVVPAATARQTMVQMMKKADDPMPGVIAREVCERTGSQAVVQGGIARVGAGFVLTEDATNCIDGTTLGEAKKTAGRPEELPAAIEMLAARLRHSLGESRRTIARFSHPLAPMTTSSLEALKDYSQANELSAHSRNAEGIELLKQAVALDPNFAAAWLDLSGLSSNTLDITASQAYLEKAYAVRNQATEPVRLNITARYAAVITGDLYEAERNYKSWIEMYPGRVQPWSGLANVYVALGQNDLFLEAARKMLELAPKQGVAYQAVADALIKTGDFEGAKAMVQLARSRGFDTQNLRYLLLRLGYLKGDAGLVAEQKAWTKANPDSVAMLANLATYAQDSGQMQQAEQLFDQMDLAFTHLGVAGAGAHIRQGYAAAYVEFGEVDLGRKWLHASPAELQLRTLLALAETGDAATARAMLEKQLATHPRDTAWQQCNGPIMEAEFAMLAGRPEDALKALDKVRAFDMGSADPMYLRGKALLQAGHLGEAEAEFRRLLAHPGIEPNAFQLPMAKVWLARTLAKEGNRAGAKAVYQQFLDDWKDADPGTPLLKQVRVEAEGVVGL